MTVLIGPDGPTSVWVPANGPGRAGNAEQQRYTPEAIHTVGGVAIVAGSDDQGLYSGELDTPFTYGPGLYTARLRMPRTPAAGLWPAFWMVNNHGTAAPQEIDVVEWLGSAPSKIRCNYIWGYDTPQHQTTSTIDLGVDLSADFHDYAMAWSAGSLTWWVDGRLVKSFTVTNAATAGTALPTDPMRLIVNCAIGSDRTLGGAPTAATALPGTFNVASLTAEPA